MIKPTIINILGQPNGIVNLKKGFDKALKDIPAVSEDLLRIAWKSETRNQSQIVVETTYGLNLY